MKSKLIWIKLIFYNRCQYNITKYTYKNIIKINFFKENHGSSQADLSSIYN